MEMNTRRQQRVSAELQEQSGARASEGQVSDARTPRSTENILQWMSYLPEDCVQTMIAMGWDVTT
jgi:hypothetical protein